MDKNIRNLITGGSGFLGSHLAKKLLDRGEEVICLDNFFTGTKKNIKELFKYQNFEFIRHDVTEPIKLEVDNIWHLACPASPIHYQYNPIKTTKTSFIGTYNMLGLAKRVGAKILLASTSEVYGDPKEHPQKESYTGSVNTTGIRSCYDEGKRVAETLCADYQRVHGVEVRIMRIFNTYGPNMRFDDGRVISNFIVQALKDQKITLYGDGTQTRSFCYVDDLINGMILLMNSNYNHPINIGNPNEFSIKELANLVRTLINPNLEFEYKKLPHDDPKQRQPSIQLAKELLNWEPEIELKDGLLKTIDWFKNNL
ncbi:UDP-glucuronic acid decarboxylase family protein [Prochlorococcus marinus]|uniref:UDP-glucuronic acid decarboxylase family protein n=1 Tax=Prochlorococcus marinus TaxID=1219 RepID=UPI001ADCE001|nr:UDP-glucuronic acid decarboxylase family protein [Prochlorococcus marinus]MBO8221454.1 SDR family oxidoreductase [Prochlorococcus marinus CUG1417]MBW3074265.1 NAD-dependent dehydratase [Prochlorococcus marinus str. MU1417]